MHGVPSGCPGGESGIQDRKIKCPNLTGIPVLMPEPRGLNSRRGATRLQGHFLTRKAQDWWLRLDMKTRDGKTVKKGDLIYGHSEMDLGFWADEEEAMKDIAAEYGVSAVNGDKGYIEPCLVLADSQHYPFVKSTPDVMGGDACIRDTRIPVWLLVAYKEDGMTDSQILEAFPSLNPADLSDAWGYFSDNPEQVLAQKRRHEESESGDLATLCLLPSMFRHCNPGLNE